jgi:hypothetical protein
MMFAAGPSRPAGDREDGDPVPPAGVDSPVRQGGASWPARRGSCSW